MKIERNTRQYYTVACDECGCPDKGMYTIQGAENPSVDLVLCQMCLRALGAKIVAMFKRTSKKGKTNARSGHQ